MRQERLYPHRTTALFHHLLNVAEKAIRFNCSAYSRVHANPPKAPHTLKADLDSFEGVPFVVFVMALCCLGPVAEEVFFRWFLFRGLRNWWGGRAAALTQAAVFALCHPYEGVRRLAILFVVGLLLQRIYLWRGTLLAPVFVHALYNTISLFLHRE